MNISVSKNWMKPFKIVSYGADLVANKNKLVMAFKQNKVSFDIQVLLLAMGMLETNTLSSAYRDTSKDSQGCSANVSLWNLSLDLVKRLGFTGDPWSLNNPAMIPTVVKLLVWGVVNMGVNNLLNFVRGGATGYRDGVSYGVGEYRDTIATIVSVIKNNTSLMTNDRRVEVFLKHV
jgi:hypothetical protein